MQIIEVTELGVRAAVIRLRHKDRALQFVIYPMIHVGHASFYAEVESRLRGAQVIVAEGIHKGARGGPSPLLSALTLSYRLLRFRRRAGLVEQNIDDDAFDVPVMKPDLDADEFRSSWRRIPLRQRLLLWFVFPVVLLGRLFGRTEALWSRAMELNDLPSDQEQALSERMPGFGEAFAGKRDRLIAELGRLHEQRGAEAIEVAVVYGAGHVAAMVHRLRDRYGYVARSAEWITVVDLSSGPVEPYRPPTPTRTKLSSPPPSPPVAPTSRPAPHAEGIEPANPVDPDGAKDPEGAAEPEHAADPVDVAEVANLRRLAERQPDEYLSQLAYGLMNLSNQLANQGRAHEALEAADEALDIIEDLRERFGAWYQHALGTATQTLGKALYNIGRNDDASALYAEAVAIFRKAYPNDPYERARSLGVTLTDYALQLLRQNRYDEAVQAAEEAVALFRAGNDGGPTEHSVGWAFALGHLARAFGAVGRLDESLATARRAVSIGRRLVARKPAQRRVLVHQLRELAKAHERLGQNSEAMAAASEAVDIGRALAATAPNDRADLGLALGDLRIQLGRAGQPAQALTVAVEEVGVWRSVVRTSPLFRSNLSQCLSRLALLQHSIDVSDRGLAAADESETIIECTTSQDNI